jgi:hypothetical protein
MSDIQHKSVRKSFSVSDAGHGAEDYVDSKAFGIAFRNWEIRRGFRTEDAPSTPLRGRPALYKKRAENLAKAEQKKLARKRKKA